jgi:uncharacterized protein
MTNDAPAPNLKKEPWWITRLADKRPDIILVAPFMVYLLLLGLNDLVPESYMPVPIIIRGIGGIVVFWLLRRHMPSLGRAYWGTALIAGVLVAAGWVGGQYLFNQIQIGSFNFGDRLFLFPGTIDASDPRADIGAFSWYAQATTRITVACITVPLVEEIFWRGFMLRALIDWDRFDKIPLGTFTWFSFVGTALLSTLQHPDNWAISIFCWFAYNGLFYWRKSLLFLMITHGVTNLALYIYVIAAEDWLFW